MGKHQPQNQVGLPKNFGNTYSTMHGSIYNYTVPPAPSKPIITNENKVQRYDARQPKAFYQPKKGEQRDEPFI